MKKDTELVYENGTGVDYVPIYWDPDDFAISFDELIIRIKNKYGDEFDSSEKQAFTHWIRLLNDAWNEFYEEKVHGE